MTLSCNCDMPLDIYCDWLQDQGWDTDELRQEGDPVGDWVWSIICDPEEGCSFVGRQGFGSHRDTGSGDCFFLHRGDGRLYHAEYGYLIV